MSKNGQVFKHLLDSPLTADMSVAEEDMLREAWDREVENQLLITELTAALAESERKAHALHHALHSCFKRLRDLHPVAYLFMYSLPQCGEAQRLSDHAVDFRRRVVKPLLRRMGTLMPGPAKGKRFSP